MKISDIHIFHKWGKWEDHMQWIYETRSFKGIYHKTKEGVEQRRRCSVCNKLQSRVVWNM